MARVFIWIIALCVLMLFVGSAALSMGVVEGIVYFNISNFIWYVGLMSTVGLLVTLLIDKIKCKKKDKLNGVDKM